MKGLALFTVAVALVAGCAAPSKEKWANADYGPKPTNCTELIQAWMNNNLVDPYSVRDLQIDEPVAGAVQRGLIQGGGYDFGWRTWASFNAKNRMGGYAGKTAYVFFFRDGQIVAAVRTGPRTLPDMWY